MSFIETKIVSNNEVLSGKILRIWTNRNFFKFTFLKSKLFRILKSNSLELIIFLDDLGYTLKDRNKNAERLINFVNFLNKQKISLIISANLTSKKYKKKIKRKFKNIFHIQIDSDLKILKRRDKKHIYKKNKNVVGKDIKFFKSFNTYDFLINNNNSKKEFIKRGNIILKKIKLAWV